MSLFDAEKNGIHYGIKDATVICIMASRLQLLKWRKYKKKHIRIFWEAHILDQWIIVLDHN